MAQSGTDKPQTSNRAYWSAQISQAMKRWRNSFWRDGDKTIDAYMLEKADGSAISNDDKYNILYSTVETTRPNMYSQKPNVMVELRHKDREAQPARDAVQLLQNCVQYVVDEEDVDETMQNVVEDYLLPGLGQTWVRYEPHFKATPSQPDDDGDDTGNGSDDDSAEPNSDPKDELIDEFVRIEYVYWQDFLVGVSRVWKSVPWVARRLWLTEDEVEERWGKEVAEKLTYSDRPTDYRSKETEDKDTVQIWEIWDRASKKVFWYCEAYPEDMIATLDDPLHLKGFFPCPRPLRAIKNNRTFVPKSFYSQYKSQANMLNVLTKRVRLLSEALRVTGVYDASAEKLQDLLNPNSGNKMIPVSSWAMFAQNGGIKGQVDWFPIDQIVATLTQVLAARDVLKNEIYEITGFADILRGSTKASETLGAQNIKANWAGARVKNMQREVQRFIRDTIAIVGEIIAEHCSDAALFEFGGIDMPVANPNDPQSQQAVADAMTRYKAATAILRNEKTRVAKVDIETDSTLLADEEAERADRTAFLGAAGSFLQQAVPAMQTAPQLGPLLGAMLMFVVRTFPSSKPIEDAFQQVEKMLSQQAAQPTQQPGQDDGKAAADAAMQTAQIKAQTDQAKIQQDGALGQAKLQQDGQVSQLDLTHKSNVESNRHTERMLELQMKDRELALKEKQAELDQHNTTMTNAMQYMRDTAIQEKAQHQQKMDASADQREWKTATENAVGGGD